MTAATVRCIIDNIPIGYIIYGRIDKKERIKPSTKFLWAEIARGFSSGSEAYECGRVYYLCLGSENKTVARKVGGAG